MLGIASAEFLFRMGDIINDPTLLELANTNYDFPMPYTDFNKYAHTEVINFLDLICKLHPIPHS